VAIDRAATLKKAEALLGSGKLDAAIVEYVRLLEDQPTDWSTGNTLGDLYVRAGDRERAVAQFAQVADSQYRQGFVAKATAFYKKALRIKSGDEHALAQLATIAVQQELFADAKTYLSLLMKQRNDRGDATGVAECLVRIAALDEDNPDPKLAAAKAGKGHLDGERVARLFVEAAEAFQKQNRNEEAREAFVEAAALDIKDPELRRRVLLEGDAALRGDAVPEGNAVGERPLESIAATPALEAEPTPSTEEPAATLEVETATGQTLSFPSSASPAEPPPEPREDSLVDLMLLLDDTPQSGPGPLESDAAVPADADALAAPSIPYVLDVQDELSVQDEMNVANDSSHSDLSNAPNVSGAPNVSEVPNVSDAPNVSAEPNVSNALNDSSVRTISSDVKARFDEMLARSVRRTRQTETQAPAGEHHVGSDGDANVVAQLEAAARTPSLQFQASAQLGRLLIGRGELKKGVEWLERAVQAPVQIPEHGMAVLYEMADALERMGESTRALQVLLELEANAGTYRDVRERIARLTQPDPGDRGA
jgi:lipopolysaccharide biosynthesis regulator YciM